MSHDTIGRLFVTGGNNAKVTSIYDFGAADRIKGAPKMNIRRRCHSSTVAVEGNIFTIGGSFSDGIGDENGQPLRMARSSGRDLHQNIVNAGDTSMFFAATCDSTTSLERRQCNRRLSSRIPPASGLHHSASSTSASSARDLA